MLWMSSGGKATDIASLINTNPLWGRMAWFISLKLGSLFVQHNTHEDIALDAKFLTTTWLRQSVSPSVFPACKHVFNVVIFSYILITWQCLFGLEFFFFLQSCVSKGEVTLLFTVWMYVLFLHITQGCDFLWTKGTSMWQDCRGHCWINCLLAASRVIHQQLATDTPEI